MFISISEVFQTFASVSTLESRNKWWQHLRFEVSSSFLKLMVVKIKIKCSPKYSSFFIKELLPSDERGSHS